MTAWVICGEYGRFPWWLVIMIALWMVVLAAIALS